MWGDCQILYDGIPLCFSTDQYVIEVFQNTTSFSLFNKIKIEITCFDLNQTFRFPTNNDSKFAEHLFETVHKNGKYW
jgi:hypothetical protein